MSPNPQETADLVKFTEEILNGKLHFLYSVFHGVLVLFWCFLLKKSYCYNDIGWFVK